VYRVLEANVVYATLICTFYYYYYAMLSAYLSQSFHQFISVPPDGDRLGVTVDAFTAVVEELAVPHGVFERSRIAGIETGHAAV